MESTETSILVLDDDPFTLKLLRSLLDRSFVHGAGELPRWIHAWNLRYREQFEILALREGPP